MIKAGCEADASGFYKWSSWASLEEEYRCTGKRLKDYKDKIAKDVGTVADREIAGSMISDVNDVAKILKEKVLYEFNSLSEKELSLLTDRQREIAELRQRYTYTQIAKMIGLKPSEVFIIFKQAVKKIRKAKRQREEGIPVGLSPRQEKIFRLHKQGENSREIAEKLNTSSSYVRNQLSIIKRKCNQNCIKKDNR